MCFVMERKELPKIFEKILPSFNYEHDSSHDDYIGEFEVVSYQILKLLDISGRNIRRLYHAAHIQAADPFGVPVVGFVSLFVGWCI